MKACGYDLPPVQQPEFARLKLQKLKEYNRVYSHLKLLDTSKHIKRLHLFYYCYFFGDKLLRFWHLL